MSEPRKRIEYARIVFVVSWFVDGAEEFTGEVELKGMTDLQVAKLLDFSSPDDLRPDTKVLTAKGIASFGKAFGIPVDPGKYVYVVEEIGFYE